MAQQDDHRFWKFYRLARWTLQIILGRHSYEVSFDGTWIVPRNPQDSWRYQNWIHEKRTLIDWQEREVAQEQGCVKVGLSGWRRRWRDREKLRTTNGLERSCIHLHAPERNKRAWVAERTLKFLHKLMSWRNKKNRERWRQTPDWPLHTDELDLMQLHQPNPCHVGGLPFSFPGGARFCCVCRKRSWREWSRRHRDLTSRCCYPKSWGI